MPSIMKDIFLLLRPQQWLKNVFIFLPIFFNGKMMDVEYVCYGIIVFIAFSFASSGIYSFNDIIDAEADKMHPTKNKRPIASGAISKKMGLILMMICFLISFSVLYFYDWNLGSKYSLILVFIVYIVMNILYCIRLKQIAIVDVFLISIGFVLRIIAGSIATAIFLSHWLVMMTFLLALFLAFAKRRDDVVIYENTGIIARRNVNRYNKDFMNQAITIVANITMVCYIMYTVSPEVMLRYNTSNLYLTSIFVLAGIIRYMQITIVDVKSGNPTKVLVKDWFIQFCIIGWIIAYGFIIYVK